MFEGLADLIGQLMPDMKEGIMKFRESKEYRKYYDAFAEALRYHYDCVESGDATGGLHDLMILCFRWAKFIRIANEVKVNHVAGPRPVDTAIHSAVEILDEPVEHCVPYYMEADALDTVSLSAYVELKRCKEINYCKTCKKVCSPPCKTHKEPTCVEDLVYCKGCRGFMVNVCTVHGPEAAA